MTVELPPKDDDDTESWLRDNEWLRTPDCEQTPVCPNCHGWTVIRNGWLFCPACLYAEELK